MQEQKPTETFEAPNICLLPLGQILRISSNGALYVVFDTDQKRRGFSKEAGLGIWGIRNIREDQWELEDTGGLTIFSTDIHGFNEVNHDILFYIHPIRLGKDELLRIVEGHHYLGKSNRFLSHIEQAY